MTDSTSSYAEQSEPLCPICQQPNLCQRDPQSACPLQCWCQSARFTPEMRLRLPEEVRDVACLCAACLAKLAESVQN